MNRCCQSAEGEALVFRCAIAAFCGIILVVATVVGMIYGATQSGGPIIVASNGGVS